jgi:hypothetical protein
MQALPDHAIPIRVAAGLDNIHAPTRAQRCNRFDHPRSLSTTPVLSKACPQGQALDTKAPFLLTVHDRFLFGATEKKMGVQSHRYCS